MSTSSFLACRLPLSACVVLAVGALLAAPTWAQDPIETELDTTQRVEHIIERAGQRVLADDVAPLATLDHVSAAPGAAATAVILELSAPVAYVVSRPDARGVVIDLQNVRPAQTFDERLPGSSVRVSVETTAAPDGQPLARVRLTLDEPSLHTVRSSRNLIVIETQGLSPAGDGVAAVETAAAATPSPAPPETGRAADPFSALTARPTRRTVAVAAASPSRQPAPAEPQAVLRLDPGQFADVARALGGQTGAAGSREARNLSMDEAVELALDNNLDIRVERLNPQTFDFSLAALQARFAPTLTSAFSNGNRVTLSNSQLTTRSSSTETGTVTWNTGVSQSLRFGGASYTLGFDNRRNDSSNEFTTRNPSYTSSIAFSFTQPLLQNRSIDSTRAQLRVTRINQEMSEVQLTATVNTTLATVRNAYWDFVYATQAVEVARESLQLANQLVADNEVRVEIGTLAKIDVVQAQAEAANRQQTLTQAEASVRTTELALKRLVASGTEDPVWRAALVPTDQPTFRAEPIDTDTAVRNALQNRTDIQQARRQIISNGINLNQLGNQLLPALDLNVNYGLSGLGGPQFLRSGLGGTVASTVPGGYSQALTNLYGLDAPNWTVSLNLNYPVGNAAARANMARARLQQQQTEAQLRQLELQIATEVTNAALQVESNLQRVEAASAARALSQERLDAEQSKFEVGLSTNYFVVQAQRDLRDSQMSELRALLDYQKSLVDYERVQETSASRGGITVIGGGGG